MWQDGQIFDKCVHDLVTGNAVTLVQLWLWMLGKLVTAGSEMEDGGQLVI